MRRLIITLGIVFFFISCGDMFATRKQLFNNYYLVESEVKRDFGIYYKTEGGDFIGRVPKGVFKYDIVGDSLIFAQTKNSIDSIEFYIIDIKKDHIYAESNDAIIGPISQTDFANQWSRNYKLSFKNVIE